MVEDGWFDVAKYFGDKTKLGICIFMSIFLAIVFLGLNVREPLLFTTFIVLEILCISQIIYLPYKILKDKQEVEMKKERTEYFFELDKTLKRRRK